MKITPFFLSIIFLLACTNKSDTAQVEVIDNQDLVEKADLIIYNTNIVFIESREILSDKAVFIENGEIIKIAPFNKSQVDQIDKEKIINGEGKYLLPGMSDMHTHVEHADDLLPFLINGITTVLNLGSSPNTLILRDSINSGQLIGPDIFAAAFINGIEPAYLVKSKSDAAIQMKKIDSLGWDLLKVYNHLSKDSYEGVVEEAKKFNLSIVGHGVRAVGLKKMLEDGLDAIAHEEEYMYSFFDNGVNYEQIPNAVELTKKSGTYLISTLSTYEAIAHQFGNKVAFDSLLLIPEMEYVRPELKAKWKESPRYLDRNQSIFERIPFQIELIKQMHKGGVKLMVGTDTPFQGMVQGFSFIRALEFLQEAGLSNWEIIEVACVNPGNFIKEKINNEMNQGLIKPGYKANLMLLNANPIEDIQNLRKISGVIKDGKWLAKSQLDEQMINLSDKFKKESEFD